jgi:sugar phosphate isomerase/epimerase
MRLAISHIAWKAEDEEAVADWLAEAGVEGIELAPARVHPRPLEATPAKIDAYRWFWERRGIRIVAMQALLFEHPEWRIFQSSDDERAARSYLAGIIRMAGDLGAGALVFGSPKNRLIDADFDRRRAVDFFRHAGDFAMAFDTCFCIEPNPARYGANFVTTVAEAVELVRDVNHRGFGIHLDGGGMTINGEDPATVMALAKPWWRHLHLSEPDLVALGTGGTDLAKLTAAARQSRYEGWHSIEMKPAPDRPAGEHVRAAIELARQANQSMRRAA